VGDLRAPGRGLADHRVHRTPPRPRVSSRHWSPPSTSAAPSRSS
jgi:hypothetical protein